MDVIVIDSVAALVPKAELEGDMGQPVVGGQARLMSQVKSLFFFSFFFFLLCCLSYVS